jgi:hypothetical protein
VKFRQMSQMYNVSIQTARKWMNNIEFNKTYYDEMQPCEIILLIDTTYFWRNYWYMIFRARFPETHTWKNLLWYKVRYETTDKYREWFEFLRRKWRKIVWIVCDWRKWLLWWFWEIPTQLCIHHMKQIVTRLLTKRPKLEPTKALKVIADCVWEYPESDIEFALHIRFTEHKWRLEERNIQGHYMHERARKAYRSIKNKLTRCYTSAHYPDLKIPKTNNSLESINSHLKSKASIHRWMNKKNKQRFTNYYLYNS